MSDNPDSKVHGANKGPTWVLSAPDEPHVGPMNLAIREVIMPTNWAFTHMDGHKQTQTTIPEGQSWPRVETEEVIILQYTQW